MKTLKKVVLPLVFIALAATAMVLVAFAQLKCNLAGGMTETVKNITFGANEAVLKYNGSSATHQLTGYGPSIMPLLGFILIGLGLVAAALGLFLVKKEQTAKIVVLVAACLVLVGGAFQFFALPSFARATAKATNSKYEAVIKSLKDYGAKIPLCTIGGVLGVLASLALAVRAFLPEKK